MRVHVPRRRWKTEVVEVRIKPRRRIRWPFVRRKTHDRIAFALWQADEKMKKQEQALAKLGHARDKAYRDAAQVLADLRVLRVHIERTPYKNFYEGPLRVHFEIADGAIYDAYRRSGTFREIVGYYIEDAFMRSPEGRSTLFTQPSQEVPNGR